MNFARFEIVQRAARAWRRAVDTVLARSGCGLRVGAVAGRALDAYRIARFLQNRSTVTITETLLAIGIPRCKHTQLMRVRVGTMLRAAGFRSRRLGGRGARVWSWVKATALPENKQQKRLRRLIRRRGRAAND